MQALRTAWNRYRARKSAKGIVIDFLFLAAMLTVCITPLRRGLMTYALRAVLIDPAPYDKVLFLSPNDSMHLHTASGQDTTLCIPPQQPTIYNVGSIWSAQSRAELRSLNSLATRNAEKADVFFITTDTPADVLRYMSRKGYGALKPLFAPSPDEEMTEDRQGIWAEIMQSVPASLMVDKTGQVIIKKMGAAYWNGKQTEETLIGTESHSTSQK